MNHQLRYGMPRHVHETFGNFEIFFDEIPNRRNAYLVCVMR